MVLQAALQEQLGAALSQAQAHALDSQAQVRAAEVEFGHCLALLLIPQLSVCISMLGTSTAQPARKVTSACIVKLALSWHRLGGVYCETPVPLDPRSVFTAAQGLAHADQL